MNSFKNPELELVIFENEDVITVSGKNPDELPDDDWDK